MPKLADLGLQPEIGADMPSLLRWLDKAGLTHLAEVFDQGLEHSLLGPQRWAVDLRWLRRRAGKQCAHSEARNSKY